MENALWPFAPRYSAEATPFWQACREHRLVLPWCPACTRHFWPASVLCPHCGAFVSYWKEASGRGTVYAFTVFHRAFHPALEAFLPYVVATVQMDEGVLLSANLASENVACGSRVTLGFKDFENHSLPEFHLLE